MRVLSSVFLKSAAEISQAPKDGAPELAFVGRSNVGKSSMINALLNRKKLARVSNTPGRTQLLNFFSVEIERTPGTRETLSICDLPGYGYAKAPRDEMNRWRRMIEGYLHGRASLRGTVVLLDSRHLPSALDRELFAWMDSLGRPVLPVATKIDKWPKSKRLPALQGLGDALGTEPPLSFSSETGEGETELWNALLELAHGTP